MLSRADPLIRRRIYRYYLSRRLSNFVSIIKNEHREFEDIYRDHESKIRWQNEFTAKVTIHALGEELIVFPAMEKHVEGGSDLADRDREETQEVRV